MKFRNLVGVMLVSLCAMSAGATDLSKIDRSIRREPVYRSAPAYCLLVFGAKAEHRVWLVLDGETLYVDRNGNGDLTEEDERIDFGKWQPQKHIAYSKERRAQAGNLHLGALTHDALIVVQTQYNRKIDPMVKDAKNWQAYVDGIWKQTGNGVTTWFYLDLDPRCYAWFKAEKNEKVAKVGHTASSEGLLIFGRSRAEAPVLHFGGPLTFRAGQTELRAGKQADKLMVHLGTQGLGAGTFVTSNIELMPDNVDPFVDIEFPFKTPGRSLPVRRFVLDQRC